MAKTKFRNMNFKKGGETTKLKNLTTNVLKNWIGFIHMQHNLNNAGKLMYKGFIIKLIQIDFEESAGHYWRSRS